MRNLILPFILLLTFVFSCRENSNDDVLEKKNPSYDVYIAGTENNKACYWKNTIKTELTNGDNINTMDIKVENNDVYVTGVLITNTTDNGIQYFWKNNIRTDVKQYLSIPNNVQYDINSFTINNGDVYFAGYVENPAATNTLDRFELCYWKNGVKTILYKSQYISTVKSILVDGSDVYVSVTKVDNNQNAEKGYYKNTVFNSISTTHLVFNFIKNNNGIHLLIFKNNAYYSFNINSNTETILGGYILPVISGKLISDKLTNDLYMIYNDGGEYYKNTTLVTPNSYQLPYIKDLFVLGNNIYMIKYKFELGYNAKVLINGVASQDISGTFQNGNPYYTGTFNSIYVVEN
ncbi:hypothetical protein [Chryseobacterium oryctis]|uniref:Lipoprotein n=1 Tax=Chryseobacterium oryctis TaxID=2952618 RepID=A0ABT3HIV8_9FLAO|nr:hypothetical protein [Chryseobacterium oryctis]MCW3159717.1 hypothetical protein [Chryseobacterium oryctis]